MTNLSRVKLVRPVNACGTTDDNYAERQGAELLLVGSGVVLRRKGFVDVCVPFANVLWMESGEVWAETKPRY